ncbi:MAG: hypothetical protein WA913_02545 [Pricia sp.]
MDKKTRILLIVIGILSTLASIYGIFTEKDSPFNYFGIFIGLSLIGVVFFDKRESDKNENQL